MEGNGITIDATGDFATVALMLNGYFGTDDASFADTTGFPFNADGVQMHVIEIGARVRW